MAKGLFAEECFHAWCFVGGDIIGHDVVVQTFKLFEGLCDLTLSAELGYWRF